MTRRDTIIAAVLVNAGLLIVLFASALKSDSSDSENRVSVAEPVEPVFEQAVQKETLASAGDEVDQVLKQYAQPLVSSAQPVLAPSVEAKPAVVESSFADDLRAIALPEVSAQPAVAQAPLEAKPVHVAAAVIEYKVKKGDVLEKIARHHHSSVHEIMQLNHLKSVNLRIGQILKIPSKASSVAAAASKPAQALVAEGSPKYYTVKNGDNPWTIAVKNQMKVEDLLKLNNLDQEKARKLKPGDQLRIN